MRTAEVPVQEITSALELFGVLPDWLAALADSTTVAAALERNVPELASADLELRSCEVRRVRIKKRSRAASYRVTVRSPESGQERIVDLRGEILSCEAPAPVVGEDAPFGSDRWRSYLPELHLELRVEQITDSLPAVSALIDPEQARTLLEEAIRSGSPTYSDLCIEACSPRVMRVKQSRYTVLYDLEFPPEGREQGWPTPVVAKTYAGKSGRNAYAGMVALWQSRLRTSSTVRIAEPLAYVSELTLLLQGPVPSDRTLKEVTRSAFAAGTDEALREVTGYLEKTAVPLILARGGCLVRGYASFGMRSISWRARAWVGLGSVTVSKVARLPRTRLVLRTTSASSPSRVRKEWQVSPAVVRLVEAFRWASGERSRLVTGSSGRGGASSSKSSSAQALRRCHSR